MPASGAAMLEGSSGIIWAMMSSRRPTLSTSSVLKAPEGVSSITPMGTRRILSAIARRIFFKMGKEILWLRSEDFIVRYARSAMHTAAAPAMSAALCTVAVPP